MTAKLAKQALDLGVVTSNIERSLAFYQGALGCAQMDRADAILSARTRLAHEYDARLAHLDWLYPEVQQIGDWIETQAKVTAAQVKGENVVPLRV